MPDYSRLKSKLERSIEELEKRGDVSERDPQLKIHAEQDFVNHPPHYTNHPSGIECIEITEHMGFCLGNAVKYIWRADLKADPLEDLQKAMWYLEREIKRRLVGGKNETVS